MMEIVILDGYTLNPGDLSWEGFEALGTVRIFDRTAPEQLAERIGNAEAVIVNKVMLNGTLLKAAPRLRYIGVTATGVNNVDLGAARERGITVTNVKGYSSASVAQHTFALLLALTNHLELHSQSVQAGDWVNSPDWCYKKTPLIELQGKTLGLIGLGDIGTAVAKIGRAFGMRVVAYRRDTSKGFPEGIEGISLEELFRQSDVVSLHCPLTPETAGIINSNTLSLMKPTAFLLNTGRGPLIQEDELAEALRNGQIAGAGIDVLSAEPPRADNPLLHAPNCVITPHIAWATFEARRRLLVMAAQNLKAFMDGEPRNVVS